MVERLIKKKEIIYAVIGIFYILVSACLLSSTIEHGIRNIFRFNYIQTIAGILVHVLFGFLLGVDSLLKERKKQGKWSINRYRVFFLVIPSLFFALYAHYFYIFQNFYYTIPIRSFFGF